VTRSERKVYNTLDHLSAKAQLQEIEIEQLKARLQLQETQGKRQQTLFTELRSQTDTKAMFFSPAKIQVARDLLLKREQHKLDDIKRKRAEKDKRSEAKLQKQQELIKKREQRAIARVEREQQAAEKRQARAEERHQKLAEQQLISQYNLNKKRKRSSPSKNKIDKPCKKLVLAPIRLEMPKPAPSRSRPLWRLPERFCN
jgi:hypothetical protein